MWVAVLGVLWSEAERIKLLSEEEGRGRGRERRGEREKEGWRDASNTIRRSNRELTHLGVFPHVWAAMDSKKIDTHISTLGEDPAINLRLLSQLPSNSRHRGIETEALLNTVLQVGQLL